jgi:glycosyltransferase involved in cell wall biosynthesis
MRRHKLSVALCTYNGERFLAQQLESIAQQLRLPDELIICDDGSTDNTLQIVRDFTKTSPFPIELKVNVKNLGSTRNFESAIRACHGDFIALCDQDDYWLPEKLSVLETCLIENPDAGLVFSDGAIVDENLVPTRGRLRDSNLFTRKLEQRLLSGDAVGVLLQRQVVTGATVLFRATFRDLFLPIPASWVHDGWIALIIALFSTLLYIDTVLIKYRQHPSQQIGAADRTLAALLGTRLHLNRAEFRRQLGQTLELADFLYGLSFPNSDIVRSQIAQKALHLEARAAMPSRRLLRLPVIASQYLTYRSYAQGWKSALRDFMAAEPHSEMSSALS